MGRRRGGELTAPAGTAGAGAPAPIITFTPNPTVDLTTRVGRLEPGVKLRCAEPLVEPGGGGVNAARVVAELGGRAHAVHTAGGPAGERLVAMVRARGVEAVAVPVAGETRQSFTVHEDAGGRLYRFVLPGPALAADEAEACLRAVEDRLRPGAVVLASGSLPPDAPDDLIGRLARCVRDGGGRLLVDMAGAPMRAALEAGVYLARFNRPEFEEYAGRELPDPDERMEAARRLVADGRAEAVIATIGADGALLAADGVAAHLRAPRVEADSPVGAGDSMMGAVCVGLAHGWGLRRACALGVAAAAAAHMTPGTGLCRREDVARLYRTVTGEAPPAPVGAAGAAAGA